MGNDMWQSLLTVITYPLPHDKEGSYDEVFLRIELLEQEHI